jgi:hypothetical protein
MNDMALIGAELCYWWEAAPTQAGDVPAVYRWVVRDAGTGRVLDVIVGETHRLSSHAPDSSDAPVQERLNLHRAAGHEVRLEVLHFTHFEVGGKRVAPSHLADRTVRRLLENLFAFQHAQEGAHRPQNPA